MKSSRQLLEDLDTWLGITPDDMFGDISLNDEPGPDPGPVGDETDDMVPLHATKRRKKCRKDDDQKIIDFVMQFVRMRAAARVQGAEKKVLA